MFLAFPSESLSIREDKNTPAACCANLNTSSARLLHRTTIDCLAGPARFGEARLERVSGEDSLAALAPLFFLCRLRGLFLFGASGSGALLMDAFFSATLSRPPLERVLAWVVRAPGTLVDCHRRNMRSIFRGCYPLGGVSA
jgi:hypothetical protein